MALQASDVFIVQQSTGAEALAKVTAYELTEFIESTGGLHYKGSADFTDASQEPADPQIGDMWVHSGSTGTFAWTYEVGVTPETVVNNQKTVWNGTYWDILSADDSDAYVTDVTGTLPINVDTPVGELTVRNITIDSATTTATGTVQLATQDDLDTSSTTSVVTANQLASVIADVDQIQTDISSLGPGTVTQVTSASPGDPITVTNSTTTPTIAIKDASTTERGVTVLASQDDLDNSSTTSVVTADQLKSVISDVEQIQTDISGLGPGTVTEVLSASPGDPITITNSTTTPTIAIKDASTTEKGVVTLATQADVTSSVAGKVVTSDLTIDGGVYAE